jgi:hypothetical protein
MKIIFLITLAFCGMSVSEPRKGETIEEAVERAAKDADLKAILELERTGQQEVENSKDRTPDEKAELAQAIKNVCQRHLAVLKLSDEEASFGADNVRIIGPWRIRSGELTNAGASSFAGGSYGMRFAWATQTIGDWTLGISLLDAKKRSTRETAGAPAGPAIYLRGPKLLKPGTAISGKFTFGKSWTNESFPVLPDGTLRISDKFEAGMKLEGSSVVTYKFGESVTRFDLKQWAAVHKALKERQAERKIEMPKALPR